MKNPLTIIWYKSSMIAMYVLVGVCIWVLGFYKLEFLEAVMGSMFVAKSLCSNVCLFHSMSYMLWMNIIFS